MTIRTRTRRAIAGFSLIEIMVAILLLGVTFVGMTRGVTTAMAANKESELQTTAALIAAGQIETLRAEGYVLEGTDEGDFTGALENYRWTMDTTETELDGLFEVVVRVEHVRTEKLLYELRTLLFDPPLLTTEDDDDDEPRTTRERILERADE